MRTSALLLILFLLFNCTKPAKKAASADFGQLVLNVKDNPHGIAGSGMIILDSADNCSIPAALFRKILNRNPGLKQQIREYPDIAFATQTKSADFFSEQGQDEYYRLYAYLLRQNDDNAACCRRRKNLVAIYRDINAIYGQLARGGTYFGHEYARIPAYAEYAVYLYRDNSSRYKRTYSIAAQKNLYIRSLRQLITDEIRAGSPPEDQPRLKDELFKTIGNIDSLITDYFYLKQAQAFQHSNY